MFSLKSKSSSEDKKPRLSRVAPSDILQALRLRVFKELKLDKGDNTKLLKFELLLGNHHEVDGGGPLHLSKDNISRFLNKEKEEGSTLIAVPSAQNSQVTLQISSNQKEQIFQGISNHKCNLEDSSAFCNFSNSRN